MLPNRDRNLAHLLRYPLQVVLEVLHNAAFSIIHVHILGRQLVSDIDYTSDAGLGVVAAILACLGCLIHKGIERPNVVRRRIPSFWIFRNRSEEEVNPEGLSDIVLIAFDIDVPFRIDLAGFACNASRRVDVRVVVVLSLKVGAS
jgi:hypothetical protein